MLHERAIRPVGCRPQDPKVRLSGNWEAGDGARILGRVALGVGLGYQVWYAGVWTGRCMLLAPAVRGERERRERCQFYSVHIGNSEYMVVWPQSCHYVFEFSCDGATADGAQRGYT